MNTISNAKFGDVIFGICVKDLKKNMWKLDSYSDMSNKIGYYTENGDNSKWLVLNYATKMAIRTSINIENIEPGDVEMVSSGLIHKFKDEIGNLILSNHNTNKKHIFYIKDVHKYFSSKFILYEEFTIEWMSYISYLTFENKKLVNFKKAIKL